MKKIMLFILTQAATMHGMYNGQKTPEQKCKEDYESHLKYDIFYKTEYAKPRGYNHTQEGKEIINDLKKYHLMLLEHCLKKSRTT